MNLRRIAQGIQPDLAFHTLGWKAFQDLCIHVCGEIFRRPVEVFREAGDGGQDAILKSLNSDLLVPPPTITVQCKFTSRAERRLAAADIASEIPKVRLLLSAGEADNYLLLTNMGIDAPVALEIKKRFYEIGVKNVHVFGREFLTRAIRGSVRLRALVPRVYGLGDLSIILDERAAEQARALLGHMAETLMVYVPTAAHVGAVRSLAKHKLVLLIGDPGTGKSTIAAVLATTASEDASHRVYKADGPEELLNHWNPNEKGGFYWIDDAFGANQLRDDFIERWVQIIPKVMAATSGGNHFVLTSRRHIYEAAKRKLGSRNHPLLKSEDAIVDVGTLTVSERQQILYNHVKMGRQSRSWRRQVKPYLETCAKEISFLPEIARRLGDPTFTKKLILTPADVIKFFREPREHLVQTIDELASAHKAALVLVFLHRGRMATGAGDVELSRLVSRFFNVDTVHLAEAFGELKNSFLMEVEEGGTRYWRFKHPTIADALTQILAFAEGMSELFLRGANLDVILGSIACIGVTQTRDVVVIGSELENVVVGRLAECPDEPERNRLLFDFLAERASDGVLRSVVRNHPDLISRKAHVFWQLGQDAKIRLHARLCRMGLLSPEIRAESGGRLQTAILEDHDASFLDDDNILGLIAPTELLTLPSRIKETVLEELPRYIERLSEDTPVDLDSDPSDAFSDVYSMLTSLRPLFSSDPGALELFERAEGAIDNEVLVMRELQDEEKRKHRHGDWDWESSTPGIASGPSKVVERLVAPLSIFSDVDE